MSTLIPVILAGGSGTRLWPLSRDTLPKQLGSLIGDETLLQQTARRVLGRASAEQVVTVGAASQDFLVQRQLSRVAPELGAHRLVEPVGRNTAAAIALAACYTAEKFGAEALLWVCPSDHLMQAPDAIYAALDAGAPVAVAGELVTFGIHPSRPETAYGYIRAGEPLAGHAGVLRAAQFVEKPAPAAAEAMLAEGRHFWNSGMFLFRADRILAELAEQAPEIHKRVEVAFRALRATPAGAWEVPQDIYESVPAAPIDKAVMERTARLAVVPCDPGWSDLGSWQALWEQLPKDAQGNASRGDVLLDEAENCLVHAGRRLVTCSGVRDLAVIETDDVVLVSDRRRVEPVRRLVAALAEMGRPEATAHAAEQRPWGSFQVLHEGSGFKVKEIIVRPGQRLSLQSHRCRAEHWVVVAGTAVITLGKTLETLEERTLEVNQSVHIPLGAIHRMANPGDTPMHIIEVQCGTYLGEDDIIRYEDDYERK